MDFYGITLIARWVLGWVMRPIARPLPKAAQTQTTHPLADQPTVAIIVPARNEADNLPILLAGLSGQTYASRIVVVDDHSTDGTAQVALAHGAEVMRAPELPSGWTGKSWACWQGAQHTQSDILVFLDADTVPASNLIASLVNAVQTRHGLISVQPYHQMVRATERLAAIFNLLGAMGAKLGRNIANGPITTGDHTTNRNDPMAFGPVLATTRADYRLTGGHEAIRSAIVEDVALGKCYQRKRLPVSTYAGRHDVAFRMYPAGVRQMFEGFVKNLATGLANSNPLWSLGVIVWFSGVMVASWELPYALAKWLVTSQPPSPETMLWAIGLYVCYALQIALMLRPLGNFGLAAALMPIGVLAFIAVFGWSVIKALQGEVNWKGRVVATRTRRRSGHGSGQDSAGGAGPDSGHD